ncbi:MAG: hypothetical protein IT270_06920 [Saprospiraceae bacterium]|nr:hypothetical protein [Saprospiraceae bacterium]
MTTHHIQKQAFELLVPTGVDAYALQERVHRAYLNHMLPVLEAEFSGLSNDNHFVRINKLELNLGVVAIENLEAELSSHLEQILKGTLMDLMAQEGPDSKEVASCSGQELRKQALLHFLKTGNFPWWMDDASSDPEMLLQKVLEEDASDFLRMLKKASPELWSQRLLKQFAPTFFWKLAAAENPEFSRLLNRLFDEMNGMDNPQAPWVKTGFQTALKVAVLDWLFYKKVHTAGSNTVQEEVQTLFREVLKTQMVGTENGLKEWLKSPEVAFLEWPKNSMLEDFIKKMSDLPEGTSQKKAEHIVPNQMEATVVEEPETWYIDNAGLVLAAPFFAPFFKRLGLVEDRMFVSEDAREQAVLWLQYLVTGDYKCSENQLLLNKLLCAWPLHEPVQRGLTPHPANQAEAEDLLFSLIQQWGVLGNTTTQGLRQSFLMRPGKISHSANGYIVHVERQGIDVLIDKVPWSLSLFRLPWMQQPIHVEW